MRTFLGTMTLTLAVAIAIAIGGGSAWANDGQVCHVLLDQETNATLIVAAVRAKCQAEDALHIAVIPEISGLRMVPPYSIAEVCRLDRQVLLTSNQQEVICVYVGSPRLSR